MPSPPHPQVRVAADIGGTFTDLALIRPDGGVATCKVPSTPGDYGRGVIDGITQLLEQQGLVPGDVGEVLHACTIATNAILEAKGARTGLITTAGFRDVLELRRIRVPRLYEPLYRKPPPLVPRRLRLEVAERMDWQGQVLEPLDEASVMAAIDALIDERVEAVAVCLLHSYANPAHERRIGELLRARMPGAFVSLSVDILPEIREYERTSTTVINAYVGPPVHGYLNALVTRMAEQGLPRRLFMMHSAGGIVDAVTVMRRPAQIVECGPAAGVLSARHVGALAGYRDVISFDMGGTTAKASLIEGGALQRTDDYEVGGGISLSSKLAKGGGYALKLPVIDISEVGAGGGSIVWIDRAGALKVGPHSAGARPGPACYDAGGTEPTVTDANVVLGYLNPDSLAGGTLPIKGALSHAAIARAVAGPMGMTVDEAAFGVHELVTTVMTRAVKSVTTYRGRDPREFTLFAFGGNGGIHAVSLARTLGIQTVVVPPGAGVFSALGLLYADVETGASAACLRRIDAIPDAVLEAQFTALERGIAAELGQPGERVAMTRSADLRYAGQAFELTLPFGAGPYGAAALDAVRDAFEAAHARSYGYRLPGVAVEVVTLRAQGRLLPDGVPPQPRHALPATAQPSRRRVWFGPGCGAHDTLVTGRAALEGAAREGAAMAGPLVIEEYEGTTLVPPGCTASLDAHMNIVISVGPAPGPAGDAATEVAPTALRSIDPIRLEVVKNAFDTIADEMALILMRAAHSPIVRDSMDFSTALCDPAGQTLAQGVTTPMHLGSFYDAMRHLIARYAGDVVAGDTFVGNDPYAACGQHLPDFYIVQPIFIGPRLVGWATTVAHHADVGGIVPGSNALGATEIIQEGIRVPFLKLEEAGRPDRKLWEMIALNVRVPEQMVGDLNAQIAACNAGRRGLSELMARYGIDEIERYGRELHDYAERLTRAEIEEIPDGTYSFTDHLDGLGQHPVPIVFQCRLTVDGSTIHVDWTGSSRQVAGGVNTPLPFTKAGVYTALRSVMTSDIPNCHGFTRAITVTAPPGTVVNSVYPAPTGARGITGYRVIDCIFGALAAVLPDRVTADGMGGSSVPAFGGWANGRPFVFSETLMGTWGAARTHDGQEGVPHMGANQANVPVEMMEASFPLRVRRYGIVPDTGGAGRHRGGNSLVRDYEYLAEEGVLTMRSDKRDFPPHGLEGGQPGCGPVTLVNPGANERLLPVLVTESVMLKQGDLVHHQTPSGGGHGDPFHRDPADVLEDVLEQKVSPARARDAYGVAVTPAGRGFELDLVATAALRAAR